MTDEQIPLPEPEPVRYKNPIAIQSFGDLLSLDAPQWQIQDYIPNSSICTLYGAPGCGKSFVAQAFALSTALGEAWNGREVAQGGALYLACEGVAGIPKRVQAWVAHHNLAIPEDRYNDVPFYYTTGFNDLRGPGATTDLIRAIQHDLGDRGKSLKLVVLDTLSRTLGGADENSAGEMNMALDQLDRVRDVTGATILILHHTAKSGLHERGSSVLRGACDTMMRLEDKDSHRLLIVDKQRDWEEAEPLQLFIKPVQDSMVFVTTGPTRLTLTRREKQTYQVIKDAWLGVPMSYSTLVKVTEEPESSLQRTLKNLCSLGLMVREEGKRGGYVLAEQPKEDEEHDDDPE